MRDVIAALLLALAFFGVVFGVVFMSSNYYLQYKCASYSKTTGMLTVWRTFDDCYIQLSDGEWYRMDEYTETRKRIELTEQPTR